MDITSRQRAALRPSEGRGATLCLEVMGTAPPAHPGPWVGWGAPAATAAVMQDGTYPTSRKGAQGLTVGPYRSTYSRILQFHRDQASDSGEVVTPFMQDGTYPTRNFATLGPILTAAVPSFLINS